MTSLVMSTLPINTKIESSSCLSERPQMSVNEVNGSKLLDGMNQSAKGPSHTKAPRRGSLQESAAHLYGVGTYATASKSNINVNDDSLNDDESNCNDDTDYDDDDSDDDSDDDMLQRALRNATMSSYSAKGPSHLNKLKLEPLKNYQASRLYGNDDDDSESSASSTSGTDYGYDDEATEANQEEEKQHFIRRNSCLINKRQSLLTAVLETDSMLGSGTLCPTEGLPRLSDRDLKYEQQRKADLVIAMYNQ